MPHVLTPEILQEFLPTVQYWARHYTNGKHQVLDFDDLVVVGLMGLIDAAKRYHPRHKTLFKTYAEFRIRGEILDELRRQDWMSRTERRKQKQYRQALSQLEQHLGRSPSDKEMAKVLPFEAPEIIRLKQYEQQDTLRPYNEGDLSPEAPAVDQVEVRDEVEALLEQLPPVMSLVLRRRYFEDAPLAEIAREVGLTEGRISQLHGEGLNRLRELKKVA